MSVSKIAEQKEKKEKNLIDVSFVVTGFGPFGGMSKNPSTVLVQELKSYLESRNASELATRIEQSVVLETSAKDVRDKIDEILAQPSDSAVTIFLHLGVNYKGTGFQLEQCAYNDANFRIPDQQGYQPKNLKILDDSQLCQRFDTQINIQKLLQNQTEIHSNIESKCSIDPGRFVCNYLYFYSLKKLQSTSRVCIFLHVPPFTVVEKEAQLAYVSSLMEKMVDLNIK